MDITQKLLIIPDIVEMIAIFLFVFGYLIKLIIFNDNTGSTQGIKFKMRPPNNAIKTIDHFGKSSFKFCASELSGIGLKMAETSS